MTPAWPQETEPVQPAPTQPGSDEAPAAPAAGSDSKADAAATVTAEAIEVSGSVDRAAGTSPLASEGWTAVAIGDRLESGTLIRTGLRSHVNLRFGETTIVSIRSATHASINQFYRSATTEHVRVGLGYGTVRGGSSEGRYRSDVIVDSTVATLAKRGTEGWEMWVEPVTGRFRISLSEEGLVEAIRKRADGGRESRSVRPGEYATDANIANMWINQASFDRLVELYETEWVTDGERRFALNQDRGLAFLGPAGTATVDLSGRVSAEFVFQQTASLMPGVAPPTTAVLRPVARPEGNFGTGPTFRVLLPQMARRLQGVSGRSWLPRGR